jgi:cell division protein FtsB
MSETSKKSTFTKAQRQVLVDALLPVMQQIGATIKALEARNATLDAHVQSLEQRVLELEADRAVTIENVPHDA